MSEAVSAYALLKRLLETTQEQELDCDQFQELLAPWLDGKVDDQRLAALIEHHRHQCPECGQEVAVLQQALAPGQKE